MGRRSNTSDSRRYYDWLDYAEADITAALDLSDKEKTYLCSAFHCQQAIEKTLKAYFLYEDGYAPDGHNVIFLCRKLSGKYREFEQWIDECIETNNYYIQTRYPPDKPLDITKNKLEYLIRSAKRLFDFTSKQIENDLRREENGNNRTDKGNTKR